MRIDLVLCCLVLTFNTVPILVSIHGRHGVNTNTYTCILYIIYKKHVYRHIFLTPTKYRSPIFYKSDGLTTMPISPCAIQVPGLYHNICCSSCTFAKGESIKIARPKNILLPSWSVVLILRSWVRYFVVFCAGPKWIWVFGNVPLVECKSILPPEGSKVPLRIWISCIGKSILSCEWVTW